MNSGSNSTENEESTSSSTTPPPEKQHSTSGFIVLADIIREAEINEDYKSASSNYIKLGNLFRKNSKLENSLKCFKKGLKLAIQLKDLPMQANCYGTIGIILHSMKDFQHEIEFHKKALQISKLLGNKSAEHVAILNMASAYRRLNNYSESFIYFEKDFEICEEIKDKINCLCNMALCKRKLKKPMEALNFANVALKMATTANNRKYLQGVYSTIASCYFDLGNSKLAITNHNKELSLSIELQDRLSEARCITNLGDAYALSGNYDLALFYFKQKLVNSEIDRNKTESAKASQLIAATLLLKTEYKNALDYSEKAIQIARDIKDPGLQVLIHSTFGDIYSAQNDSEKSRSSFCQALAIASGIKNFSSEIVEKIRNNLEIIESDSSEQVDKNPEIFRDPSFSFIGDNSLLSFHY